MRIRILLKMKTKKRISSEKGMTMAELLVVVAIIGVLAGVAFIAVQKHQRDLGQLERDGIAKEIFVAAQNHLTMAYGEGYLGTTIYGNLENIDKDIYYYVVDKGNAFDGSSILDQMLPFGSIDETIRGGGSYIIRYQKSTGHVLDVFYCSTSGAPASYNHSLTIGDYGVESNTSILVKDYSGDDNKGKRNNWNGAILGWYGSSVASDLKPIQLKAPSVKVTNAERLYVTVTDPNSSDESVKGRYSVQLRIKGESSEAEIVFILLKSNNSTEVLDSSGRVEGDGPYTIVLDDITVEGKHFGQLVSGNDKAFIPGENIIVEAKVYSNESIAGIMTSGEKKSNSLFASISDNQENAFGERDGIPDTAYIRNIRHLENLDKRVSNLDHNDGLDSFREKLDIKSAVQTSDMSWDTFKTNTNQASTKIFFSNETAGFYNPTNKTKEKSYFPVDTKEYLEDYDGKRHSISKINIDSDNMAAGLFGESDIEEIKNLKLIDFNVISGTKPVGALAGSLTNEKTIITNVVAYETSTGSEVSSTDDAGGLIGKIAGGTVQYCSASLIVNGKNSGGLIGSISGDDCEVLCCYSGGHVEDDESKEEYGYAYSKTDFNVTGTNTAGGLIGEAGKAFIENSYSTCSVSGTQNAGGFVGKVAEGQIINCYCTGLVDENGANVKAFIGTGSPNISHSNKEISRFYEVINEIEEKDSEGNIIGITHMDPGNSSLKPIDESASEYDDFVGNPDDWKPAKSYSNKLKDYYSEKYNLKTVEQLEDDDWDDDEEKKNFFVRTHYGDWPAPEIFVINTPVSSGP